MKHWILWVNIIVLIFIILYVDGRHSYKEGLSIGYNTGYEEGYAEAETYYSELLEKEYYKYDNLYALYEDSQNRIEALEDSGFIA